MRLELGRRADYAIRATTDLARRHGSGQRRKAREIAEEMAISLSYLPQILAELVRSGLVVSVAGPAGGYQLARDPAEISLLDVVQAVEVEAAPSLCILRGGPCRWDELCAVHVPWFRAQQATLDELGRTSFADVVAIDEALEAGTYEIPDDVEAPRFVP